MYKKFEDIVCYKLSSELSDYVWKIFSNWDWMDKKIIGDQFIRAIDSIGANIAEGFGRFHKKDKIKFYYYARGSLFESAHWCKKTYERKLINEEQYNYIITRLRKLPREINYLIKITNNNLKI